MAMTYLAAIILMVVIVAAIAAVFWGVPLFTRERPSRGRETVITAAPPLPNNSQDAFGPGSAGRKEGHGGWRQHLHASPALEWYAPGGQYVAQPARESFGGRKESYGEPPGALRAVHQDELGFRGWADMPGDFEGSSASAVSAYVQRSA